MAVEAALIEAHIPGLRRFARALLRGDREGADDLVQDCLERALSRWHLRRAEGDLRGWLYTIFTTGSSVICTAASGAGRTKH